MAKKKTAGEGKTKVEWERKRETVSKSSIWQDYVKQLQWCFQRTIQSCKSLCLTYVIQNRMTFSLCVCVCAWRRESKGLERGVGGDLVGNTEGKTQPRRTRDTYWTTETSGVQWKYTLNKWHISVFCICFIKYTLGLKSSMSMTSFQTSWTQFDI